MEVQDVREKVEMMISMTPYNMKREMIAKSRWTCDSHGMMAMAMNAGWDVANKGRWKRLRCSLPGYMIISKDFYSSFAPLNSEMVA